MGSDGAAIAVDPTLALETYFVPQGISADIIATEYGISRDDADAFAVQSQRRAKAAWDDNRFARSVVPVTDQNGLTILAHDEYMRPETDMQRLGALEPSFRAMGEVMPGFDKVALLKYPHLERINHIHHAGNSSGIVDGAAGLLSARGSSARRMGSSPAPASAPPPRSGSDPSIMLTGPLPRRRRSCATAAWAWATSTCSRSTRPSPRSCSSTCATSACPRSAST
jgi:acetyl-CoA C-acetyltransferase